MRLVCPKLQNCSEFVKSSQFCWKDWTEEPLYKCRHMDCSVLFWVYGVIPTLHSATIHCKKKKKKSQNEPYAIRYVQDCGVVKCIASHLLRSTSHVHG